MAVWKKGVFCFMAIGQEIQSWSAFSTHDAGNQKQHKGDTGQHDQ